MSLGANLQSINKELKSKHLLIMEIAMIIVASFLPLLFKYPFRFNLFLAWEGAYRISEGQIPFKDFSLPMGADFWIIPAIFFKLFGPKIFSLIIAQCFINLVSILTFRGILKILKVNHLIIFLCLIIYGLSYNLFNLWPWYNHSVFVFELIGIFFSLKAIFTHKTNRWIYLWPTLAGLFSVMSFFTKQDSGFLGLFFCGLLFLIHTVETKKIDLLAVYIGSVVITVLIHVLPFIPYNIGYWFNYGQEPHFSRVTLFDLLHEFMGASYFIKFYLLFITGILIKALYENQLTRQKSYLLLLVYFILFQASIIQVTSYTPVKGNIYFHSFAIAGLFTFLPLKKTYQTWPVLILLSFLISVWWSGEFWNRYISHHVAAMFPPANDAEQVISKNTYLLDGDDSESEKPRGQWKTTSLYTLEGIRIPEETEEGIAKIAQILQKKENPVVLNMSELTFLAYELEFELLKGVNQPLWFHKNVSIFDKQIDKLAQTIKLEKYDMVLFQDIPGLNNFYPYELQAILKQHYEYQGKFLAPRIEGGSYVEIYIKRDN